MGERESVGGKNLHLEAFGLLLAQGESVDATDLPFLWQMHQRRGLNEEIILAYGFRLWWADFVCLGCGEAQPHGRRMGRGGVEQLTSAEGEADRAARKGERGRGRGDEERGAIKRERSGGKNEGERGGGEGGRGRKRERKRGEEGEEEREGKFIFLHSPQVPHYWMESPAFRKGAGLSLPQWLSHMPIIFGTILSDTPISALY